MFYMECGTGVRSRLDSNEGAHADAAHFDDFVEVGEFFF